MTLGDDIEKVLGERMADWQKDLLEMGMIVDSNYAVPAPGQDLKLINIDKISGYFEVPRELLETSIYDECNPPPPAPWHKRARWRWQAWRHIAGVKIGSLIAGFDLDDNDE